MPTDTEKPGEKAEEAPDLARHYRPVAIRAVLAAHAMIPREKLPPEPLSDRAVSFSLPDGFHTIPED